MKKYIIKLRNFIRKTSKKKLMIILGMFLVAVLIIGGVSYAYVSFTITGTKDNLIDAGCLKVELTEVNNINLTNSVPMLDEKGLTLTPYTYTIENVCTTPAYYETDLAILNTSNSENISKVKVALRGNSYLSPTIISALEAGNITDSSASSTYLLDEGYLEVGETKTFDLRMWVDYDVTAMTGELNAKILINAIAKKGPSYNTNTSGYTVYKNTEEALETGTNPSYSYIAPYTDANNIYTQTSGLFKVFNSNNKYEYYFRGSIDNNYVSFANLTWRIAKINEDGSLKLILDDVLTSSAYSSSATTDSLTYANSTIKTTLETWYTNNLNSNDKYILSYDYCNDLSSSNNYYGSYTRNVTSNSPSYTCGSDLTNLKIGLLTADEVAFAGGLYNTNNTEYYLYKNSSWWTMSPAYYSDSAYMFNVDSSGALKTIITTDTAYIRPVINLTSDAILSGTGIESNQYKVIGLYSEAETYSDTTPPIITYVKTNSSNQILISATDGAVGVGIGGYYISTSSTIPTTASEGWLDRRTENLTTDTYASGTYYIWAKDLAGNISDVKTVTIKESEINSPELASNMIPVYYDETTGEWRKADKTNYSTRYKWYDYDNKMWANAVTVTEVDGSRTDLLNAEVGTEIPMDRINTMWVWIPRFNATSNGDYNGGTADSPGPFNITFVSNTEEAHDAFTFGEQEINGFWYAKFETTGTLLTDTQACSNGACDISNITILPNQTSLRNQTVSSLFYTARSMEQSGNPYGWSTSTDTTLNVHMSKNREWAAVAYLTQSEYGRCTNGTCSEITMNNCSSYITGIGADSVTDSSSSTTCTTETNMYNGTSGVLASTTGNITGIYDMSGGAYEYVMGVYSDGTNYYSGYSTDYNSGFNGYLYNDGSPIEKTDGIEFFSVSSNDKYYDVYTTEEAYKEQGLQHAVSETPVWYGDYAFFVSPDYPWFDRSGGYDNGTDAGAFAAVSGHGRAVTDGGARVAVIVK